MLDDWRIRFAALQLARSGVIAYPTEAVYGLGCDPLDEQALQHLYELKGRPASKGFILIASDWCQLESFVKPLDESMIGEQRMVEIMAGWPGPNTWILPARSGLPMLLVGERGSLAVRVTAHPLAARLCRAVGGPIVSTSANHSGQAPARSVLEVRLRFAHRIDYLLSGPLGGDARPSVIRDGVTGQQLR